MPAEYTVESAAQEVAVISPTATLEVTRFGIRTHPSDVLVYVNVPQPNVNTNQAQNTLMQYAQLVEVAMQHEGVTGIYFAQDVDKSGLLADYFVVVVGYTSGDPAKPGPYEQEVWLPSADFGNPVGFSNTFPGPVDRAYQRLVSLVEG